MPTRKEGKIETPFSKIHPLLIFALLFLSFAFANLYLLRSELELVDYYFNQMGMDNIYSGDFKNYIALVITTALIETGVNEFFMSFFYFIGFRIMRGMVPFSLKEFKINFRPFIVIRNILTGVLSLLCFLPSGYFVSLGTSFFDVFATLIIIVPAFIFFKKYYVKEGYERRILLAFSMPFAVINIVSLISSVI